MADTSLLFASIDPNWLYSSVAQSSAAIVGLMGAFLTTKLITKKSVIKGIETRIKENSDRIEFLNESIKSKQEWVKSNDDEEDANDVEDFLREIRNRIDPDKPPTVDALLEAAKTLEDEKYRNLKRDILEKYYNADYIESVRKKQAKKASLLGGSFDIDDLPIIRNAQVEAIKNDRYNRNREEIRNTLLEIKFIEDTIKSQQNELSIEKAGADLKTTFYFLAVFSFIGVFMPLSMMTLGMNIMYCLRFVVIVSVLLSWSAVLVYLIYEIKTLKKTQR